MKRILIILLLAVVTINAFSEETASEVSSEKTNTSAFFLGGIGTIEYSNATFSFGLEPQIGYEFNHRIAIGTGVGFVMASSGGFSSIMGIVEPFVRVCAWHNEIVFVDFKATSAFIFDDALEICQAGVRPSLRFRVSEHCDLAADIGLFGAQYSYGGGWQPVFGLVPASAGLWFAYRF